MQEHIMTWNTDKFGPPKTYLGRILLPYQSAQIKITTVMNTSNTTKTTNSLSNSQAQFFLNTHNLTRPQPITDLHVYTPLQTPTLTKSQTSLLHTSHVNLSSLKPQLSFTSISLQTQLTPLPCPNPSKPLKHVPNIPLPFPQSTKNSELRH